jgi:hypothetical protein
MPEVVQRALTRPELVLGFVVERERGETVVPTGVVLTGVVADGVVGIGVGAGDEGVVISAERPARRKAAAASTSWPLATVSALLVSVAIVSAADIPE